MYNQFNAKLLFYAVAWRAFDRKTKIAALIIDENAECRWSVSRKGVVLAKGTCVRPQSARAAVRRTMRKLGAEM